MIVLLAILAGVFGYLNYTSRKDFDEPADMAENPARPAEERTVENHLPDSGTAENRNGNENSGSLADEKTNTAARPRPASGEESVLPAVPFAAQAPFGEWSDPRQQDGCEEVSVLMAMRWVAGAKSISKDEAKKEILAISDYEEKNYGGYHDTSAADTADRIIKEYFKYGKASVKYGIGAEDVIGELEQDNLIIVPANGRALGNPNFTPPGPDRHMLVVKGYDAAKDEFITNDPGTRQGENYRYKSSVLINAVRDYPSGNHLPIVEERKAMIVIEK